MIFNKKQEVMLPTKEQVETERRRYRRQKAYNKSLRGTVYVLTIVAAVAVLIATLVLPVLQIEGTSMEPTLYNGDIVLLTKSTNFKRGELCGSGRQNHRYNCRGTDTCRPWFFCGLCNGKEKGRS